MNIDFLRSKSKLMKKRLARHRTAARTAFGESQSAYGVYQKEFGEAYGEGYDPKDHEKTLGGAALKYKTASETYSDVYSGAKETALKTFKTTATGKKLDEIGSRYNIKKQSGKDLSAFVDSGGLSNFASNLRKGLDESKSGGKWKQAQTSAGMLDAYFSGQKWKGEMVHDSLVQRHARTFGLDTKNITFSGGKAWKSRQGKRVWTGSLFGWQWDPYKNWEEDVSHKFSDTKGHLKKMHADLGYTQVEEDIGYLTGEKKTFDDRKISTSSYKGKYYKKPKIVKGKYGLPKMIMVDHREDSADYKAYKSGLDTEEVKTAKTAMDTAQGVFQKEKGDIGTWNEDTQTGTGAMGDWKTKEGIFSSAKERFDATSADYTKLTGRIKKWERLGLGQEIKSKKYRKVQAGAGSYL